MNLFPHPFHRPTIGFVVGVGWEDATVAGGFLATTHTLRGPGGGWLFAVNHTVDAVEHKILGG